MINIAFWKDIFALTGFAVFIGGMLIVGVQTMPDQHKYHCHSKNHKLYKSIKPGGNVFLKGTEDCIDIRDIKRRKK